MRKYLYRFRPIGSVLSEEDLRKHETQNQLSGFDELRKNQLFLSPLENLNDPMEGYKNTYWKGDKIIWRNFLKHYAMCLSYCMCSAIDKGPTYRISKEELPVRESHRMPDDKVLNYVFNRMDSCEHILGYIDALGNSERKIYKNELNFYLSTINSYISCLIMYAFSELSEKITPPNIDAAMRPLLKKEKLEKFLEFDDTEAIEERNAELSNREGEQKLLTILRADDWEKLGSNFGFDFTSLYIAAVEDLLYPKALIACFSERFDNPSMWSHYANNHSGICLKFRAHDAVFPVETAVGIGGNRRQTRHLMGSKNLALHEVIYDAKYPEIDFFNSLGQLTLRVLSESWLYDEEGNRSTCLEGIDDDPTSWREQYWRQYAPAITKKLSDWQHEKEFRAISSSLINQDFVSQNTSYYFSNLEGIIFGINTKDEYKLNIIEIINEKCLEHKRKTFEFYQSYYNPKTNKVEKAKLEKISKILF